jgi:hypothetical protein
MSAGGQATLPALHGWHAGRLVVRAQYESHSREAAKRAVALGLRPAAVVRAAVPLWKVLVGAPTPAI